VAKSSAVTSEAIRTFRNNAVNRQSKRVPYFC